LRPGKASAHDERKETSFHLHHFNDRAVEVVLSIPPAKRLRFAERIYLLSFPQIFFRALHRRAKPREFFTHSRGKFTH
jgi:hypothetical protein